MKNYIAEYREKGNKNASIQRMGVVANSRKEALEYARQLASGMFCVVTSCKLRDDSWTYDYVDSHGNLKA